MIDFEVTLLMFLLKARASNRPTHRRAVPKIPISFGTATLAIPPKLDNEFLTLARALGSISVAQPPPIEAISPLQGENSSLAIAQGAGLGMLLLLAQQTASGRTYLVLLEEAASP